MSQRVIRFIGIMGTASLAACTPSADTDNAAVEDTTAEMASAPAPVTQQEVEQSINTFLAALHAGDTAALPNRYAPDATFVTARGKLDGDAVRAFWMDAVKAGQGRSQEVTTVKFGASGDMAYLLGRYTGGITSPSGHTLQVWQKQADGKVSIVAQVSVPDPAAKQ
jgi:ketosteroid isomerase-like protein